MGLVNTRVCEECGKPYERVGSRGRGLRFCSRSCRTIWSNRTEQNPAKRGDVRAKISAARKGKPTTGGPMPESQKRAISEALTGRVLSAEWRANIGAGVKRAGNVPPRNDHLVGSAHPNWKGGSSPARQADYNSPEYRAFRDAVFARDEYRCRECGFRPTNSAGKRTIKDRICVHHVKAWASHPALRYEIANAVTLCHACHSATHRGSPPPRGAGPRTLADLRSGQTGVA